MDPTNPTHDFWRVGDHVMGQCYGRNVTIAGIEYICPDYVWAVPVSKDVKIGDRLHNYVSAKMHHKASFAKLPDFNYTVPDTGYEAFKFKHDSALLENENSIRSRNYTISDGFNLSDPNTTTYIIVGVSIVTVITLVAIIFVCQNGNFAKSSSTPAPAPQPIINNNTVNPTIILHGLTANHNENASKPEEKESEKEQEDKPEGMIDSIASAPPKDHLVRGSPPPYYPELDHVKFNRCPKEAKSEIDLKHLNSKLEHSQPRDAKSESDLSFYGANDSDCQADIESNSDI